MPASTTTLVYLSQGTVETGGFRYEKQFFGWLAAALQKKNMQVDAREERLNRQCTGIGQHLALLRWFFINATASVNVVPVRGAMASLARNVFNGNKTVVVIHSEVQAYSSLFLKWYYKLFLLTMRVFNPKHVLVIAIAPFWYNRFRTRGVPASSLQLFPNLFNGEVYRAYKSVVKQKRIHLGMNEPKTDASVFLLAAALTAQGYACYFSTLDSQKAAKEPDYEVTYFASFDEYLHAMASSQYTIQFPCIDEGWSRIGHESILVGTQLIGYAKGGLADLLKESGSFIVNDAQEAVNIIVNNRQAAIDPAFLEKYDQENAAVFMEPIVRELLRTQ